MTHFEFFRSLLGPSDSLQSCYPLSTFGFLWSTYELNSSAPLLRLTGIASRHMLSGMDSFQCLAQNPELAKIFDDAMTAFTNLIGPSVAASYDFSSWESLTDVGGGNGILLSHILKAHKSLRGVLADVPHVLERARQRGYLSGDLASRATMQPCNFFEAIPSGTRAYLMKSVIHDWDDDQSLQILANCRGAVPADGALLLVERTQSTLRRQNHRPFHARSHRRPGTHSRRIPLSPRSRRLPPQSSSPHRLRLCHPRSSTCVARTSRGFASLNASSRVADAETTISGFYLENVPH
jgi:hypothetical protein